MRVAAMALAFVAFVGCSSSSPNPSPSPAATSEASTSPAASAAPSQSTAATTPRCHTADLSASVGPANGAAGTTYVEIDFTNKSSAPCTLEGFPGVSLIDASGNILGKPAARYAGESPKLVTLAGGEKTHASVGFSNPDDYPSGQCTADAANMRVYPPDETQSLLVPMKRPWCPGFTVRLIGAE